MITKIVATTGWLMIKNSVAKTPTSSVTLATELVIGSGDVLIAARAVALVKCASRAMPPPVNAATI